MSMLKSEICDHVLLFLSLSGGDMRENEYQAYLIRLIKILLPNCIILKNDPNYIQGMLDLTIINAGRVVLLEVKASEKSKERPNQRYYHDLLNKGGTPAFFVFPENEQEVLVALQQSLAS